MQAIGTARARELIARLHLSPHPEGGHFREVHRSSRLVDPQDGRAARAALTEIYFLLAAGELSRWHRVRSDEVWHYLEGDPLDLCIADAAFEHIATLTLGAHADAAAPVRIVPADAWQAARTSGAYTLAACTVAPGFDYADFTMLRDVTRAAERLRTNHPAFAELI